MDTSQQPMRKSYIYSILMTIMVLLISGATLIVSRMLFLWTDVDALFFLSPVVLILLVPFLIKYGYISRNEASFHRLYSILTVAALLLLSIPIAVLVTMFISRGQILDGQYSLEEYYSISSPCFAVLTLRWCSILISVIVMSVIAICFRKIKTLRNTVLKSRAWMFSSVALLVLLSLFHLGSDNSLYSNNCWYYSSEKALLNDSKRYYENAVKSYKLCCEYNDAISKAYDNYLSKQLIDTVFWLPAGNTPVVTLEEKDDKYRQLQRALIDYMFDEPANPFAINDYRRIQDLEKKFSEPLAENIDAAELEKIRKEQFDVTSLLNNMDFYSMNNSTELRQRTEDLMSIGELIDDVVWLFRNYHEDPTNERHSTSVLVRQTQEKRKIIDERLNAFSAKYHFE